MKNVLILQTRSLKPKERSNLVKVTQLLPWKVGVWNCPDSVTGSQAPGGYCGSRKISCSLELGDHTAGAQHREPCSKFRASSSSPSAWTWCFAVTRPEGHGADHVLCRPTWWAERIMAWTCSSQIICGRRTRAFVFYFKLLTYCTPIFS